jgi:hypothetical protein
MQRSARCRALAVAIALSLHGSASAVEVQPSIEGSVNYTDNLFSTPDDEEDDTFFGATPGLSIRDEGGSVKWGLSYEPTYLLYTNFEDLNGWDHDLEGDVSWQISARTRVYGSNRFRRVNSVSRFNEVSDVAGAPAGIEARPGFNRFKRNVAIAGIEHALTPRIYLSGSYTNSLLDFSRDDQVDRLNQEARVSFDYLLRKNLRAGVRLGWSRSELKPEDFPDRTGDFYNASLTALWTPTPDTTLLASAGPTLVENDATNTSFTNPPVLLLPEQERGGQQFYTDLQSCPQLDDGTYILSTSCQRARNPALLNTATQLPQVSTVGSIDDDDVTFFANLSLTQRWDHWKLNVVYNRQDDQSVSSGVSGVVNVGSARLEYEPAPRWLLILSGAYILRESTTNTLANVLTLEPAGVFPMTNDFPASHCAINVAASDRDRHRQPDRDVAHVLPRFLPGDRARRAERHGSLHHRGRGTQRDQGPRVRPFYGLDRYHVPVPPDRFLNSRLLRTRRSSHDDGTGIPVFRPRGCHPAPRKAGRSGGWRRGARGRLHCGRAAG